MGKPKKSTKKFAQKQLKQTIHHRKRHQHHKRHKGAHGSSGPGAAAAAAQQEPAVQQKPLEEMDLDEFLDGGFTAYGGAAAAGGGSSSDEENQEPSSSGGEEDMGDDDSEGLSDDEEVLLAGMANGHAKPLSKQPPQQQQKAAKKQPAAATAAAEQDGDSSDDEEGDAAAAAAGGKGEEYQAVAADSQRLKGQISKHRQQLEALKTKDPEFYAYLQQTDAQLLGFGEGEEGEEDLEDLSESSDEGSDSEDNQEQPATAAAAKKQQQKQKQAAAAAADSDDEEEEPGSEDEEAAAAAEGGAEPGYNVTSEMLDGWCKAALKNPTLGTVKHLVQAYRAACHYGDSEAGLDTTLRISSSAVFNRVLLFMLREADGLFRRMLGLPLDAATAAPAAGPGPSSTSQQQQGAKGGAASGKGALLLGPQVSKAPRWRKVEGLVKSYLGNTLHLLGQMTEPAMLAFLLRRLRASAAFLGPFDKIQRKLLKAALQVFGTAEHAPRVQALLFVRQLALVLPPPAMERCMSGVYRAYASNAKFMSAANLPHLTFMASAMVEMTSLDLGTAYQVAFEAIKQLAVLLRNALQQKTKDSFKEVYCWQAINCMELWVKVVSAHAGRGELQPLVYPLAQLLLGAARLVPTPRYFPLRLRLIRAINRLAQATQVYIPVSPLLLEMLHWAELKKRPSGSTGAAPDMLLLLRLSKVQLRSASVQEEVVQQVLELLADHLRQWALSIAFPELAHLPLLALRGYAKASPVERFRRHAKSLADALSRNTAWVGAARDGVAYAPHDLGAVAGFLAGQEAKSPLQQYAAHLLVRAQARMAMRSTATDSLAVEEQQSAGKRKRQQEEEEESSDEEEGGSEEDAEQQQQAAKKRKQQQKQEQKQALLAALQAEGGALAADDLLQDYQLSDEEEEEEEGSEEGAAAGGGSSGSEGEDDGEGSSSEEDEEIGAGVFAGEEESEEDEEEGEEVSGSEDDDEEMSSEDDEAAGMQRPRQQQGRQMQQQGQPRHQKPQHHQHHRPQQQQQQHRSPGGGGGKPWGNSPKANGVAAGRGGHQHQRQQQHGGRGGGGGFGKPQHQRGGGRGGGRGRGGSPGGGRGGGRGGRGGGGGRGRGGNRGGGRGGR